jgi:hypothetical protein
MANTIRLIAILILFGIHPSVGAATLIAETKAAWKAYLQEANAAMLCGDSNSLCGVPGE